MVIYCSKDKLTKFIKAEIKAWEKIGGGPNLDAFEFDPRNTDPKLLDKLGYFDNIDSWIAGARLKALTELLQEIEDSPQATNL
jgi:hypothetical protein